MVEMFRAECDCGYKSKKVNDEAEARGKLIEHKHFRDVLKYTEKKVSGDGPDSGEVVYFRGKCHGSKECDFRTSKEDTAQEAEEKLNKHAVHKPGLAKTIIEEV